MAERGLGEGRLRRVLEEAWLAGVPLAERRRLMYSAVGRSLGEGKHGPAGGAVAEEYELALFDVGLAMGRHGKVSVTEAKDFLRSHHGAAGATLASKLSKLSKRRNSAVHDVSFAAELAAVLGGRIGYSHLDEGCSDAFPGGAVEEVELEAHGFYIGECVAEAAVQTEQCRTVSVCTQTEGVEAERADDEVVEVHRLRALLSAALAREAFFEAKIAGLEEAPADVEDVEDTTSLEVLLAGAVSGADAAAGGMLCDEFVLEAQDKSGGTALCEGKGVQLAADGAHGFVHAPDGAHGFAHAPDGAHGSADAADGAHGFAHARDGAHGFGLGGMVQADAEAVATAEPSPIAAAERLLAEAVQPRHRGKRRRRRALAVGRDEVVGLPEAVVAAAAVAEAAVAALGARSTASERMAATAAVDAAKAAHAAFEASLDRARQAAAEVVAAEAEARHGGRAAAGRLARARAACRSAVAMID